MVEHGNYAGVFAERVIDDNLAKVLNLRKVAINYTSVAFEVIT